MKNSDLDYSAEPDSSFGKCRKAAYSKPQLKTFGSVSELTRANSGSAIDQNGKNPGNQGNVPF